MAGYTRQSTADIIPTATVRAAPLNAEYNAIRDAFAASGGHKHDGTTAEGEYVPLISDLDNYNKVVVDSTNNRVGVFVEVSAAAVEQVRFQDGAIVPVTTNDIDLGTSSLKFKDLYIEGTSTIGTVDIDGGNIDGTVIGATTAAAANFTTMDASGNATVGGTFAVTGNTTIGGTLGVTGVTTLGTANITSVDLDSGAIDNTTIGAATPAAGTFTVLTANTSLTAATADINGGTLDGVTIGGTTSAAATVTNLTATGTSTLSTVDINAGAIDGTTIGASSAAAGSFTTVSTSGQATLATVDVNGGNIDNTIIGATTAAAITGTTITGTSFVGPVTGNVTGNLTGDVTGDLTGDVTGNITSSGSSSFNNVTIDGTLNMNAGTTATITNLTSPTNTNDAATKGYVDTQVANLVDSAPGTLDTLNELAAALGDDPNFSTTITNSIATKLPLAGGTMTGAIAMSTNKITGLGDPTAAQDAMTKAYADSNYLALSGGTMTGAIDMGSAKITTTYTPTNAADLTTKTYVDGILGSATAAAASAAAAATSETNAATSESNAATSESNAAASATSAATLYDNFDDRYLGAKASAPTVDNDGDALITGALYFNTTTNIMNVYGSSGWQSAGSAVNGTSDRVTYTATSGQTVFAATYDAGYVDVYLNGVKLLAGTDFTATNGTSITLTTGAAVNDIVDIVAYGTFVLADHYSKTQSDARYVEVAGDTMTGNLDVQGTVTSDGLTVDGTGINALNVDYSVGTSYSASNASNSPTARIQNSNGTTGTYAALGFRVGSSDSAIGFTATGTNAGDFFVNTDGGSNGIERLRIANNGDISFYEDTGTTAKFFWDASAERLGIGTTSPSASYGTDTVLEVSGSTSPGIVINDTGQASKYGIHADSNDLKITYGSSALVSFQNDGNVGIGTSSPSFPLSIQSNSSAEALLILGRSSDDIGEIAFRENDNSTALGELQYRQDHAIFRHRVGDLRFATGGTTERMRIDSSGNVGIGDSSPYTWSSVQPSLNLRGTSASFPNRSGALIFKSQAGTHMTVMDFETGNDLRWYQSSNSGTSWDERMRLDSSGNLLVGQSTYSVNNGGIRLRQDGEANFSRSGQPTIFLNRVSSDGEIARFTKDGSTVGSIGTGGGYIHIGKGDTGIGFASDDIIPYNLDTNATRDAAIDLGASGYRFKDLYLSGGVYLGGTGSANKLDDYEEGSWLPSFYDGFSSVSYGIRKGRYTKVGRFVACEFYILATGTGSGAQISISGLPFVIANGDSFVQGGGLSTYESISNNTVQLYGANSATRFQGYVNGSTSYNTSSSFTNKYIIGTFQYITA